MILGQRRGIFKWNKFQFDDIEDTRKNDLSRLIEIVSQNLNHKLVTGRRRRRRWTWDGVNVSSLNWTSFFSLSREKYCKTNLGSGCDSFLEGLLRTPEVWGSNPVIGKHFKWTFVYCQLYWIDENKEKVAGNGPFLKNTVKPIYLCSNYLSVF